MINSKNPITNIMLDIEGTTCPVDYVTGVLFPYAYNAIEEFLRSSGKNTEVQSLVQDILAAWERDTSADAQKLLAQRPTDPQEAVIPYLQWLIKNDRKLTPLKTLQGKIWHQGYKQGVLIAPIFEDVAPALRAWNRRNISITSYSSGSVQAQKLLYAHSTDGDLSPYFDHWFDTEIGHKKEARSYKKICNWINTNPAKILFVSDIKEELKAAKEAGINVLFSNRKGNPEDSPGPFKPIESFQQINLLP